MFALGDVCGTGRAAGVAYRAAEHADHAAEAADEGRRE
jgi:hypothetical protein